jgi:diaminopimelate epimerase
MHHIPFVKYHGAGNDFILLDQREEQWINPDDHLLIEALCARHTGIGADGLILLQNHSEFDFEMLYFNADGHLGSMCGNGGRCTVAFARHLKIFSETCTFQAFDGAHEARCQPATHPYEDWVELQMGSVAKASVQRDGKAYVLDTGSPHYVTFVDQLADVSVVEEGRSIRNSAIYRETGINVNFVADRGDWLEVATYERGVENETLSCGTGVTASAIAAYLHRGAKAQDVQVKIQAKGGNLEVRFHPTADEFAEVWLCGPARRVYAGIYVHA